MRATLLRLLIFIPLLSACNRDDKLPDESDSGTNTFGMEINGQQWTPYVPSPVTALVSKKPKISYYKNTSELFIEAQRIGDKNRRGYIGLAAKINGPGEFRFSDRIYGSLRDCHVITQYSDTGVCRSPYLLKDSASSKLTITRLDTAKKIVAGTFSLLLKDSFNRTLLITRGRFDSHYTIADY